jgi:Methyltransferase domain
VPADQRLRRGLARVRDALRRGIVRALRALGLGHFITLEYPPTAREASEQRTEGPLHDLIAAGEARYRETLNTLGSYADDLARIPRVAPDERSPAWLNEFIPGLDAAAIYGFLRSRNSGLYLEIGSGMSTKFARAAIDDGRQPTKIVSIDPHPRAEIDGLCDEVLRTPLELAPASVFDRLGEGDVLFFDGSHRAFTGSDATVFFLDLLPRLVPGVLVGVHDVYLPNDYPDQFEWRHYSEQYLLAAALLGGSGWLRPVLPADYVFNHPELAGELDSLWRRKELEGVSTHGGAFWFEIAAVR